MPILPRPRATAGHLLTFSVPGVGHPQFYLSPGAGHLRTPDRPRTFDARVLESAVDDFIGKDEVFVEQWLVRQGLEELADVFKGMFSEFLIFLYFVYHKTITDVNTTISHFGFKTSLAFFKFMKVELKYLSFANSNDAIFKTDLASLKCNASFKMS